MINRRAFLAGAAALAAVSGRGITSAAAADTDGLLMSWWGNPERERRTLAQLDLFQKKIPGQKFAGKQLNGTGPYLKYLETTKAAGRLPDVMVVDYRFLFEMSRSGDLLDLNEFIGPDLDLSSMPQAVIDHGIVDDAQFAVTLGINSGALIFDDAAFKAAGVPVPSSNSTWDDLKRTVQAMAKAKPGEQWAIADLSRNYSGLETWLIQRGKGVFNADGVLNFTADDAAEWFSVWEDMRKTGGVLPVDKFNMTDALDTNEFVKGTVAIHAISSNQILAVENTIKRRVEMRMMPHGPSGGSGHYLKPSMLAAVASDSIDVDRAVDLVRFLVTDPEAAVISGLERGVPASSIQREALKPSLSDVDLRQLKFIDEVSANPAPLPPPPPRGSQDVTTLLQKVADSIAAQKVSPLDGGKQFHTEAQEILRRG